MHRGRNSEASLRAQRDLVEEISLIKAFAHEHLVKIVGSYTDPTYIAYLMTPLAECNLEDFLSRSLAHGDYVSLREFYGCLAGAVEYLHSNSVRHRDLKPQNILVKAGKVFITDFGAAYDWSYSKKSTTHTLKVAATDEYMAPEVAGRNERNTASDMWSLGVIFLQMATVLRGFAVSDLRAHLRAAAHKSRTAPYAYANLAAVNEWMSRLRAQDRGAQSDNAPLEWTTNLLKLRKEDRTYAKSLVRQIVESGHFHEFCCSQCHAQFQDQDYLYGPPIQHSAPYVNATDRSSTKDDLATLLPSADPQPVISPEKSRSISDWILSSQPEPWAFEAQRPEYRPADYDLAGQGLVESPAASEASFRSARSAVAEDAQGRAQDLLTTKLGYSIQYDDASTTTSARDQESLVGTPYLIVEDRSESDLSGDGGSVGAGDACQELQAQILATIPEGDHDEEEEVLIKATSPDELHGHEIPTIGGVDLAAMPGSDIGAPCQLLNETMSWSDRESALHENESTKSAPRPVEDSKTAQLAEVFRERSAHDTLRAIDGNPSSRPINPPDHRYTPREARSSMADVQIKKPIRDVHRGAKVNIQPSTQRFEPASTTKKKKKSSGKNANGSELSSANVQQFNDTVKSKPDRRSAVFDADDFNAGSFIESAWESIEAAESIATSAMSVATKRKIEGGGGKRWLDNSWEMLEHACKDGKAQAVRELLRQKCSPGTKSKPRPKPLLLAIKGASQRHNKCVRALIAYDVDVNARWRGRTPIHWAVTRLYFNGYTKLIAILLASGVEIDVPDDAGEYPLHKIFGGGDDVPLEAYQVQTLALFLHPKVPTTVSVNVLQPGSLNSALHLAVRRRTPNAVALLVHYGADVNAINVSGNTPLLLAANQWRSVLTEDQGMILKYLLGVKGLMIDNTGGSLAQTALHYAIAAGCVVAVEMLLEQDASTEIKNKDGCNAAALLKKFKSKMTVETYDDIAEMLSAQNQDAGKA